ncbi:MAG: NUDIX hydrolase [Pseudomonadota bacterium]
MLPRVGAPAKSRQRYVRRPGVYAVLPLGRQILLTAQIGETIDIQLPGGGIDPGESPLQALHREVLEEIGWRIAAPRKLGAFRRFAYMPEYDLWAEKICHIYLARPVRQIIEPVELDHETLLLPPFDALDALSNDGDRLFLSRYLASVAG